MMADKHSNARISWLEAPWPSSDGVEFFLRLLRVESPLWLRDAGFTFGGPELNLAKLCYQAMAVITVVSGFDM